MRLIEETGVDGDGACCADCMTQRHFLASCCSELSFN